MGLELVGTQYGIDWLYVKLFFANGNVAFNDWSCWSVGCGGGSNVVMLFCCIPSDGNMHSVSIQYSTYSPETSRMQVDLGAANAPFYIYKGGESQPFQPDVGSQDQIQGIAPYYVRDSGPDPTAGSLAHYGTSFLFWDSWDTGLPPQNNIAQSGGGTAGYLPNLGAGGDFGYGALPGYFPPEDYPY